MSRHKLYQKKGTMVIVNPEVEAIQESERIVRLGSKINSKFLEVDRNIFIQNIIKLNDIFEYRRKAKFKDSEVLARAKNILQSLAYLILNDAFYAEIQRVRKRILIPAGGLVSEKEYNDWSLKHNNKKIYQETELLIKKYKLCFAKDIINLAPIIGGFISRRLKFDKFIGIVYPSVYEDALHCRIKGEACNKFVRGFDIDVAEVEDSDCNFFTNQWSYNLFPFTKLTGIKELFRDFFKINFYYENDIKDYDLEYLEFIKNKLKVDENKNRIKQEEKMNVIDEDDYLVLMFITNYFTKPSDVIKLYESQKNKIMKLLKPKEDNIKKLQKKNLSEKFSRNFEIWELQKKGLSYDEISGEMHIRGKELGDSYVNNIKGELGEFKESIQNALKRKIVF